MNRCSQCGKELTLTSELGLCQDCQNKNTLSTGHVCQIVPIQTGNFITSYCPICGKIFDVHPLPFVDLNVYGYGGGEAK